MPAIIGLWPIKLSKPVTLVFCGLLLSGLFSPILNAQESGTDAESSTASSGLSSDNKSSEALIYPSRDIRDKSLIAAAMDDEAQWLETEYGKILALYRPTEARETLGVLLLFHAAKQPQFWPATLEKLRVDLPRHGWETLAISLPQKYPAAIPARPALSSFSASASSADTEATGEPVEAGATATSSIASSSSAALAASSAIARDVLIQAYVDAAFKFLKEKGQLNAVILTDNSSAYPVLQTLIPQIQVNNRDEATVDGPLQALVIVNLQLQEPIKKQELEAIFATKQLPVLDVFFAPGNATQTESRDLHKAVAMRQKIVDYQQLLMDTQPKLITQDHQSYLVGRVRGFMQHKAKGAEVKTQDEADKTNQAQ